MQNSKTKKEIIEKYNGREIIGGVYIIKNTVNNKILLNGVTDLKAGRNRFEFSKVTGSCVNMELQDDWHKYGKEAFTLEVLDEIKKNELQSFDEFAADINALKEIWMEKLSGSTLY